jgi:hypothetical protein
LFHVGLFLLFSIVVIICVADAHRTIELARESNQNVAV